MARSFNNFRQPVEYILDQELRKRNLKNKINMDSNAEGYKGELPEFPCQLERDQEGKVIKCIYAKGTELEWNEELIRNAEGKVYRINITFPDGTTELRELFDDNGDKKLDRYDKAN